MCRTNNPRDDNWKEMSNENVKKIHIECVKVHGVIVQESKDIELFDLTE